MADARDPPPLFDDEEEEEKLGSDVIIDDARISMSASAEESNKLNLDSEVACQDVDDDAMKPDPTHISREILDHRSDPSSSRGDAKKADEISATESNEGFESPSEFADDLQPVSLDNDEPKLTLSKDDIFSTPAVSAEAASASTDQPRDVGSAAYDSDSATKQFAAPKPASLDMYSKPSTVASSVQQKSPEPSSGSSAPRPMPVPSSGLSFFDEELESPTRDVRHTGPTAKTAASSASVTRPAQRDETLSSIDKEPRYSSAEPWKNAASGAPSKSSVGATGSASAQSAGAAGGASASAPPGFRLMGSKSVNGQSEIEESKYSIEIQITDYRKIGDGMNAYMTFKIHTKTTIPDFRKSEMEVYRRFSDFLGLHEKLVAKHVHHGRVVPPPPEKNVIGMTKIKISKEEGASSGSGEFLIKRRAALERFLNRIAQHVALQTDPNFVDFLELEGDLPRASNTSALSGAGIMKLFSRVGDSIGKIAYKMDEPDAWFEEKTQMIENLDVELRRLHASIEALVENRRDLAESTGQLARSLSVLGSAEEHTALSRTLSQLAELHEKVDVTQDEQSQKDFFLFEELIKDNIGMIQAVKDVLNERTKMHKVFKDDELNLAKRRENKVRMELSNKLERLSEANNEIAEAERRLDKSREDFENISKNIRRELVRFEQQRCREYKASLIAYLESLLHTQQRLIQHWETFLPEARLIV